jgi:hypothetical protein
MVMNAKYICIEYPGIGEAIIIFPEFLTHKDMARNNAACGCNIISAGFVQENATGGLVCYGDSVSLEIKSRPEIDTALVNRMLGR